LLMLSWPDAVPANRVFLAPGEDVDGRHTPGPDAWDARP
jgi:hypothetical protein